MGEISMKSRQHGLTLKKIKIMVREWLRSENCFGRLEQLYAWEIAFLRSVAKQGDAEAQELLGRIALQGQQ